MGEGTKVGRKRTHERAKENITGDGGVGKLEPLMMLSFLRYHTNFAKYAGVVTKEFFPHELQPIHYSIMKYWRGQKNTEQKIAPMSSLLVLAKKKTNKKSWPIVYDLFKRMSRMETNPPKSVIREVQDFIIRQGMSNLSLSMASNVDKPGVLIDPSKVKQELEKLCRIQAGVDDAGIEYVKAGVQYFSEVDRGRVSTGVSQVDAGIGGGLGSGELGIIVAPFGGGKTALLVNLGSKALLQGLSVLHVTMEIHSMMVALRYDMCIGRYTTEQLREHPKLAHNARRKVINAGGALSIFDRSHEILTPLGLERVIEQASAIRKVDLCVLDYADLLRSDRGLEGRRFELGDVYRELRRIAAKYQVPLWTASQATREAARNGEFDTTYIAEDITKAHTADAIICAIQTEEQRAAGQMILKVDKTRMSADKPSVTIGMDYKTMTVHQLREEDVIQINVRKRTKRIMEEPSE